MAAIVVRRSDRRPGEGSGFSLTLQKYDERSSQVKHLEASVTNRQGQAEARPLSWWILVETDAVRLG
jgi:hypothetical protein